MLSINHTINEKMIRIVQLGSANDRAERLHEAGVFSQEQLRLIRNSLDGDLALQVADIMRLANSELAKP